MIPDWGRSAGISSVQTERIWVIPWSVKERVDRGASILIGVTGSESGLYMEMAMYPLSQEELVLNDGTDVLPLDHVFRLRDLENDLGGQDILLHLKQTA